MFVEISELPESLNINSDSVFPLVFEGETKKVKFVTLKQVLNFFESVSYNKTTGVFTFTKVDGTQALLPTELNSSIKDVSIEAGVITFTSQDNTTFTRNISLGNGVVTYANLHEDLQALIDGKAEQEDLDKANEEIDEINEMLFTHTTVESVNQEVSLNGNPNLEMNVTELDGRTEQDSTQGYQLLNSTLATSTQGTIEVTNNGDGSYTLNGTPNSTIAVKIGDGITLENGSDYTLFVFNESTIGNTSTSGTWCDLRLSSSGGNIIDGCNVAWGTANAKVTKNITSDYTNAKVEFRIGSGITLNNFKIRPMLIKGSDTTKPYEKYTGGQASPNPDYKQDIHVVTGTQDVVVSGKNKFGLEKRVYTPQATQDVTASINNGKLTASGTSNAHTSYSMSVVTGEKYTIIWKNATGLNSVQVKDGQDGTQYFRNYNTTGLEVITTRTDTLFLNILSSGTTLTIEDVMVVKGEYTSSTIGNFEPYITPITKQVHLGDIELAKIGTYKDKIYPSGGKWYLHKEVGKAVLNGTEEWSLFQTSTNTYRFVADTVISNARANTAVTAGFFNNLFQKYAGNTGIGSIDVEGIAIRDSFNGFTIRANISRVTDLAGFKAWLSTHNTIVYYILATPTDTEITGTLKEELDALQKLQQLNGTTIVSIEGNLGADFKLVYENDSISDLNTRVTSLESGKENKSNKKTSISSTSTDDDYPSGKAVYTYVNGIVGNINSLLDALNGTSV